MDDDAYFGRTAEEENAAVEPEAAAPAAEDDSEVAIDPSSVAAHLTLVDIEHLTGISYVTLQRYAQSHNDRLPHEGTGRNRRYYPAAVEEFKAIKAEIAERRKGAGAGVGARAGAEQRAGAPQQRTRKKSRARKKKTPRSSRKPVTAGTVAASVPKAVAGTRRIVPAELAAAPAPSDLDRLAHTYQLSLQLKTLDAVQGFVSEWRAKLEAELATLKLKEG